MSDLKTSELSERELEILRLVATGASNKEIAQKLVISPNTVKVHIRNIFDKIGVVSRTEAALYAINHGISKAGQSENTHAESNHAMLMTEPASEGSHPGLFSAKPSSRLSLPIIATILFLAVALLIEIIYLILNPPSSITVQEISGAIPQSETRWQKLADIPTARHSFATTIHNNQIYTIGGETRLKVSNVNERYDLESNHWTSLSPKPTAVKDMQAVVINGDIYIFGGRDANGITTSLVESYDPDLNLWKNHSPLPVPLSNYAIAAFEGRYFLFGGQSETTPSTSFFEFNASLNEWKENSLISGVRINAGAAVVGENIYLIGGFDGTKNLARNDVFFPQKDPEDGPNWESRAPLPVACSINGITVVADSIFVLCDDIEGSIFSYSPITDTWMEFTDPKPSTWTAKSKLVYLGNYLYFLGGLDAKQGPSNAFWSNQIFYTLLLPYLDK